MKIAWQYLDKRNAAIRALKDYESMGYILEHTAEEMRNIREKMEGCSAPILSGMPKAPWNPGAGEERMVRQMDEMDVQSARHQQAEEYMAWFQPAWEALSEDERYLLQQFFCCEDRQQIENIAEVCERFHIERTSAYKKKDRALAHLALLLYGK